MNIGEKVADFIERCSLVQPGNRLLVAFSGGPDSACLLTILSKLFQGTTAVYINHNLRGEESQQEEQFVRNFCKEREIPLFVETLEWKVIPGNLEEAARRKRYLHYSKVASEHGLDRVALGHQKDDVAETFLLRLIRGSGPAGLAGIPAKRGIYIRPLLECTRKEILQYLAENCIPFFTDSTNSQLHFQRNRIRHELIPYIRKNFNPAFPNSLSRTIDWIKEQNRLLEELLQPYNELIHASPQNVSWNRNDYDRLSRPLQKAVLRRALWQADPDFRTSSRTMAVVLRAIERHESLELPGFLHVRCIDDRIILSAKAIPGAVEVDVPGEGEYFFPSANAFLNFSCVPAPNFTSGEVAVLDFEKASFPLHVRNARKGDRFQPLGMSGHKKLSDFFIDRKIPRRERKCIPLVFKNDDLIWVAGQQIHQQYRVTEDSKKFLRIELKKNV